MEYKVKKREFQKDKFAFLEIFFDNGDYFIISKSEIRDFSVNLYDELILGRDYWNSCCAVIESGYLKLKIQKQEKGFYSQPFLYDLKEFKKDRISYIQNRLCTRNDEITCIKLFDNYNWHFTLYCKTENTMENGFVILKFLPHKNKSFNSEFHTISLPAISKSIIQSVELDFENCDGITIDKDEIVDIQLKFKNELCWGSSDYIRNIEKGFIKIKLDDGLNEFREHSLYFDLAKGTKGSKQIISYLCGKDKYNLHDICHLYINYDYADAGFYRRECLEIDDVRGEDDCDKIEDSDESREDYCDMPYFIGGYVELQKDNTILITFGDTSNKYDNYNKLIKEYLPSKKE